jgi:drug/metabolite transporter (DMT)-like permease
MFGAQSTGILAAILTVLCWTIGTFAFANASNKMNPSAVNRIRLVFATVLLSCVCMVIDQVSLFNLFTNTSISAYVWFGLSGIIGLSLGDYFAFNAYQLIGGPKTALMSCIAPAAALFFGYFMLDETLSIIGLMGIFLSMTGIFILVYTHSKQKVNTSNIKQNQAFKGFLFAFLGAVCQGIGLVFAKYGFLHDTDSISAIHATWIRMLVATIVLYLIVGLKKQSYLEFKEALSNRHFLQPIAIGSVFGPVIGVSLSLYATKFLSAGITQTLLSLLPASVTLTSLLFFKEKLPKTLFIALFISLCGVFVLIWRTEIATYLTF